MCVRWEEGERLGSPGHGGGCDEWGGDAPGSGRGRSSVSRGRAAGELGASRARAPSSLLARLLAFSITPSLPPSLPPGGRGGAGEAAKRSGPALEECGSAEGAEPDAVSPRFEQPEPRLPNRASGGLCTRAAGGNRDRESREGRDSHTGTRRAQWQSDRQTRIRPRGHRDAERARDIARNKDTANKGVAPDLEGNEREQRGGD